MRTSSLLLLLLAAPSDAFLRRVYMDWVALNARSTTRHIMLPLSVEGKAECLRLKQSLREQTTSGTFVVEAFAVAAAAHSLDLDSRDDGGIIGRRLRQGVCREPELDRACFCEPLGQVSGPVRTAVGYHLVLVEERVGLTMHDAGMSRVVPQPTADGGVRSILAPPDPDEASELVSPTALANLALATVATFAGGQMLANFASSLDVQTIANSVN